METQTLIEIIADDPQALQLFDEEIWQEVNDRPARLRDGLRVLSTQHQRLEEMIAFAARTSPFYRRTIPFRRDGTTQHLPLFRSLPIVRREDYRYNFSEMISDDRPVSVVYREKTSGTTGTPIDVLRSSYSVFFESVRLRHILEYYLGEPWPFIRDRCAVLYVSHFPDAKEHVYRDPVLNRAGIVKLRTDRGDLCERLKAAGMPLADTYVLSGTPSSLVLLAQDAQVMSRLPRLC